jgi:hypothetical protein
MSIIIGEKAIDHENVGIQEYQAARLLSFRMTSSGVLPKRPRHLESFLSFSNSRSRFAPASFEGCSAPIKKESIKSSKGEEGSDLSRNRRVASTINSLRLRYRPSWTNPSIRRMSSSGTRS